MPEYSLVQITVLEYWIERLVCLYSSTVAVARPPASNPVQIAYRQRNRPWHGVITTVVPEAHRSGDASVSR